MGEIDYKFEQKINCPPGEEYSLLCSEVVCGDAELLYLDTFLREIFSPETVN